jgi:hypothetical protein
MSLEGDVLAALMQRGYGIGDLSRREYVTRQFIKMIEEAGEVARELFDGKDISPEELADIAIPLLAIFAVEGVDFADTVRAKVRADIARGVRA